MREDGDHCSDLSQELIITIQRYAEAECRSFVEVAKSFIEVAFCVPAAFFHNVGPILAHVVFWAKESLFTSAQASNVRIGG